MEHRTAAVESLLMNVSQDPYSSKAKSYQIEEYKIFLKVCYYSTTAVASPNMLAAVGQDVYVHLLFFFLLFLPGSKKAL